MRFGKSRVLIVAFAFIGLHAGPAPAQQPPRDEAIGRNAALRYWQAFAHLPNLNEAEQKLLAAPASVGPPDQEAAALADRAGDALLYLSRGAAIGPCDWGLHPEDGPYLLLPHLAKGRQLARLASLRARAAFSQGDAPAGVDAAADALVLGRHLSTDQPTIISYLVQLAVERVAIDALAGHLAGLEPAALERLERRLNDLPPGGSLEAAMRSESESFTGWAITRLGQLKDADPWKQQVLGVMTSGGDGPDLDALIAASGGNREGVRRQFEALQGYFEKLDRILPLRREQFAKELAALDKQFESNPLAKAVLPSVQKAYDRDAVGRTRMTLLRAAVAVARGGPERAKAFKDAGGSPVEYRATDDGFELRSKVLNEGQPVVLKARGGKKK